MTPMAPTQEASIPGEPVEIEALVIGSGFGGAISRVRELILVEEHTYRRIGGSPGLAIVQRTIVRRGVKLHIDGRIEPDVAGVLVFASVRPWEHGRWFRDSDDEAALA